MHFPLPRIESPPSNLLQTDAFQSDDSPLLSRIASPRFDPESQRALQRTYIQARTSIEGNREYYERVFCCFGFFLFILIAIAIFQKFFRTIELPQKPELPKIPEIPEIPGRVFLPTKS